MEGGTEGRDGAEGWRDDGGRDGGMMEGGTEG